MFLIFFEVYPNASSLYGFVEDASVNTGQKIPLLLKS
jgi:hypothetical protein